MFEHILQEIQQHDTIILHRHSKPDGDAMGSQIGLKHLLRENFPCMPLAMNPGSSASWRIPPWTPSKTAPMKAPWL